MKVKASKNFRINKVLRSISIDAQKIEKFPNLESSMLFSRSLIAMLDFHLLPALDLILFSYEVLLFGLEETEPTELMTYSYLFCDDSPTLTTFRALQVLCLFFNISTIGSTAFFCDERIFEPVPGLGPDSLKTGMCTGLRCSS